MTFLTDSDLIIGVAGAGAMGAGIAQVAAASGRMVLVFDSRPGAAAAAREGVLERFARRVADGKEDAMALDMLASNLRAVDELSALAPCGLVIEAIIEDVEAKRALFTELAGLVGADTVLASNTSSIPIGVLAAKLPHPERVVGLHFFNPVPVMRLVEVIRTPDTANWVIEGLLTLARAMGRTPVEVRDTPGFLVNFGGRAYTTEALAIVQENVATPAQIDAIMRDCCGFRMGPFELMDLTGMDVNYPVTAFVHQNHFADPRLRSTPQHRYLFDVGQLGRKTGRGFFDYGEGAVRPDADARSDAAPASAVVVPEPNAALLSLLGEVGTEVLAQDDGRAPILVALTGEDGSSFCARTGADHRRLVALDLAFDVSKRVTLMTPPQADKDVLASVVALFAARRAVTVISDSAGFVAQRICGMVANLGCEMAQIGLARPADIDIAMQLGLNYPLGPLALADRMGTDVLFEVMSQLQRQSGDDRYRPSQWLRRRAQLGLSALAE